MKHFFPGNIIEACNCGYVSLFTASTAISCLTFGEQWGWNAICSARSE